MERSAVNSFSSLSPAPTYQPPSAPCSPLPPDSCADRSPSLWPCPTASSLPTAGASRQQGQESSQRDLLTSQILFLILPLGKTPHWPLSPLSHCPRVLVVTAEGPVTLPSPSTSSSAQALPAHALRPGLTAALLPHACTHSVPLAPRASSFPQRLLSDICQVFTHEAPSHAASSSRQNQHFNLTLQTRFSALYSFSQH